MAQILLLFSLHLLWAQNSDNTDIILSEKQSADLKISNKEPVFVEDGSILKIMQFRGAYKIVTKKSGFTRVYTSKQTWQIYSLKRKDFNYYQKIHALVEKMRGMTTRWSGGCTILSGKLLKLDDLEIIQKAMLGEENESCNNTYKNQLDLDASYLEKLPSYLENVFSQQNVLLPTYNLNSHLKFFIAESDIATYTKRFSNYGFIFVGDKDSISTTPNIETEIIVTEVRKKDLTQIGIGWPSNVEIQVSQKNIETLPFSWNLQAIEESGFGKVLASPKILSVGGKEAEFLAGGEIPLRAMGYKRNEVIWKPYGILLKVLPIVDVQRRLRLKLQIEVSMLDASQKVDGLPGFLTNRIQSEFFIKDNEALVISGLLKEFNSKSTQGLPGLVNIPILGKLFGSEDYQNNKTELVILVRPRIQKQ
ncbi:MAG: hypothetical protein KDD37_04725 [Bdellovibrionales bacterium]|nr:hypothetical protein [Bdellovibrionales bacterium]